MSIHRNKARSCWVFDFDRTFEGVGRVRTTKRLPKSWSRAQADAFDRAESARLYALATGVERPQVGIEDAVTHYLRDRAPSLKSGKRTAQELALCWWAYKGKPLSALPEVCAAIREKWLGTLAPATIRNRIRYLTSACRWAWKHHNACEHDPAARVIVPAVDNERQRYIDRRTMLQVARAIKPIRRGSQHLDARAALLVAFYSGMRLGEVLRAIPTPEGWSLDDTKNGRPRIIPIHSKVAHIARRWPRGTKPGVVQKWFSKACAELGLTDLHVHDLRHSTASAMINSGVDLLTVGAILGHKSMQSTRRYSHLATATLADALGKVGKRAA